jgi:hypothetical protein
MGRESWAEVGRRLKKAVKKFKLLLTLNVRQWCLRSVTTEIQRARSFASDDDIDKRAEIFIANFRRHLRLERQASLERSYSRSTGSSFEGDKEN